MKPNPSLVSAESGENADLSKLDWLRRLHSRLGKETDVCLFALAAHSVGYFPHLHYLCKKIVRLDDDGVWTLRFGCAVWP